MTSKKKTITPVLNRLQSTGLLVRSGVLLTIAEIVIRKKGFQKCKSMFTALEKLFPLRTNKTSDLQLTQQIADIVDKSITTTSIYPAQCLTRALVLDYFLARYGQDTNIKLGVRNITGQFQAHAWVESQGVELNEPEPACELYTPLDWVNAESGVPSP